jgi:integrase
LREIEEWRNQAVSTADNAWVFPSERMTPLAKENSWRRSIIPKLEMAGLEWVNFHVMRRTHASLMSDLGIEGKPWRISSCTVSMSTKTFIRNWQFQNGRQH